MAQNLTNFDKALKIDYLPAVREQLNNASVLLSRIQRNTEDVVGKQWQLTTHHARNSGVGARPDTGALPSAGNQSYLNPYGTVRYNYGRVQVTGPTMAASANDKGAVIRALDSEIKGITADLKKDVNFQLFGDGTSLRCLVNGDPGTGTTLTVDGPGTKYLSDGMLIDITDAATGVLEDTAVEITSVNSDTEVTVSAALDGNIENNSRVVRSGSTDGSGITASDSYEMMGLKGIVDDGTYLTTLHNLSRTTYPWWKCSTHSSDDNSGTNRDLTLDLMQASLSAVEKNGGKTNLILTTFGVRDAYAALVVADKRFVNTMDLDGGFKGLEYNGIPLVADADALENTMLFLDTDRLFLMQMSDWDWMDKDGAILSRVSGYDAYEAILYLYADLVTDRPRSHSFLRDVQ